MTIDEILRDHALQAPHIEGFEIVALAGKGGMSVVYKARQVNIDRVVAIKMLHPHLISSTASVQRFVNEGRLSINLKHNNVAAVYFCGLSEEQQPYLVLEFLEGTSLRDLIDESQGLPVDQLCVLFIDILKGLQAAHAAGIVHRDLKPGNVMLVRDPEGALVPKIVDFGVAKLVEIEGGESQRLTRTGALIGSPAYMSPEQCMGAPIDPRSDIYSIGCMMFEALTGRPLFEGETMLELLTQHIEAVPVTPSSVSNRPVMSGLDDVILRCLAKRPEDRYQDCGELIAAIKEIAGAPPSVVTKRSKRAKKNTPALPVNWKSWIAGISLIVIAFSGLLCWQQAEDHKQVQQAALRRIARLEKFMDLGDPYYEQGIAEVQEFPFASLDADVHDKLAYTEFRFLDRLDGEHGIDRKKDIERWGYLYQEITALMQKDGWPLGQQFRALSADIHPVARNSFQDIVSFMSRSRDRRAGLRQLIEDVQRTPDSSNYRSKIMALAYTELAYDSQLRGKDKDAERFYQRAETAAQNSKSPEILVSIIAKRNAYHLTREQNQRNLQRACAIAQQFDQEKTYEAAEGFVDIAGMAYVYFASKDLFDTYIAKAENIGKSIALPGALRAQIRDMKAQPWK